MSGRKPPVHSSARGTLAQWRRANYNKYNHQRDQTTASSAKSSAAVSSGKSYEKAAVDKREYRAKRALATERERVEELEREIQELRREATRKQLIQAAQAEENIQALLEALEAAQAQIEAQSAVSANPLDFRNSNGEYSCEFARLCAKVLGHGTPASYAGEVIREVAEFVSCRKLAAVPCPKTLGEMVRTAAIVAEAVVGKALHDHAQSGAEAKATIHVDETPKNGVSLHGTSWSLPGQTLCGGVIAMPSKSAQDQLAANDVLRNQIAESAAAVFGHPVIDPIVHTGAFQSDSGATEECIRRGLEEKKQTKLLY